MVLWFTIAQDGTLTHQPGSCFSNSGAVCTFYDTTLANFEPQDMVISADGRDVYVTDLIGSAVVHLRRNSDPEHGNFGALAKSDCFVAKGFKPAGSSCVEGRSLIVPIALAFGPDDSMLYVTAVGSPGTHGVAAFSRDSTSGTLTQLAGLDGCITQNGKAGSEEPDGECRIGRALARPNAIKVAPNGNTVYVAASDSDALSIMRRNASGGLEAIVGPEGCIANDPDGDGAGAPSVADCTGFQGLNGITFLQLRDSSLYTSAASGAITAFDVRDDGFPVRLAAPKGCLSVRNNLVGCAAFDGMAAPGRMALSPDGRNLYVAPAFSSSNRLISLIRGETAPACTAVERVVGAGATITIPLVCADAQSDPFSRSVRAPARGSVGAVDETSGSVTYTAPATPGRDSFTFSAADDFGEGAEAVVGIDVVAGAGPPATPATADPQLACVKSGILVTDVVRAGRRARVTGVAQPALAGQPVAIVRAGRRVASAVVAHNGSFSADAPLPPRNRRATARFAAVIGSGRSAAVRLVRQTVITKSTARGGRVSVTGRYSGPLRPSRPRIELRARTTGCARDVRVGSGRVRANGRFSLSGRLVPGVDAAVYRVRVLSAGGRSVSVSLQRTVRRP